MRIQNNIMAMNTHRMYTVNNSAVQRSAEKLSSGYRVNRAGDDAAGLAISEKMRAQIRGLTMASKNSQDAVSLVQTAEGALQEVHSMLQRMNELAVQSASGTNDTGVDRAALQQEFQNLQDEIDQIAETTTFNDMKIMDGTYGKGGGANAQRIPGSGLDLSVFFMDGDEIVSGPVDTENPNLEGLRGSTIDGYDSLKEILSTQMVPQAVEALTTAFDQTFAGIAEGKIGVGLNLVNEPDSGYNATFGYTAMGPESDFTAFYQLTVNVAKLTFEDADAADPTLTADGRKALESTILHEMMHGLMAEALTGGMMGIDSETGAEQDRFPKWFIEGAAQAASGASDWVSSDNPPIMGITEDSTTAEIAEALGKANNLLTSGHTDSQYATGYLATMYLAHQASGSDTIDAATLAGGMDTFLKSIQDGKSLDEAIAQYTDYEDAAAFEQGFATDADVHQFVSDLVTAYDTGAGALAASDNGGLTASDVLADEEVDTDAQPGFKLDTDDLWIQNKYPQGSSPIEGGGSGGSSIASNNEADGNGLVIQTGAEEGQTLTIYIEAMNTKGLGIEKDSVDIATQESASKAITAVREAVNIVSTQRAELGAMQNRLEHKISNLDNTAENLSAAESRIRDVDMAKEMTEFTKQNILSQAATAMLAQANSAPQGVLALLQ